MQKQGYKKGDIIAQFMLNSDAFMAVYYGVQLAGLTIMPINTKLAPPEVEYIFKNSEAKVLFYDEKIEQTIEGSLHSFNEQINSTKIRDILNADEIHFNSPPVNEEDTCSSNVYFRNNG